MFHYEFSLLLEGKVENIVINDFDKAIKQKEIYISKSTYSLDLAFATLFLNRTNHSGILTAGLIAFRFRAIYY